METGPSCFLGPKRITIAFKKLCPEERSFLRDSCLVHCTLSIRASVTATDFFKSYASVRVLPLGKSASVPYRLEAIVPEHTSWACLYCRCLPLQAQATTSLTNLYFWALCPILAI